LADADAAPSDRERATRIGVLRARGFRNLTELALEPGPRFNVIAGDNGQGKSNLLEAIEYLGSLGSFRGAATSDMIARGADEAELAATLHGEVVARQVRVRLQRNAARELSLDGKRPRSRASYLGAIQTVLFHPGDLQLTAGAPELRRALLDRVLERFDATYAATLAVYERALRSRNRLLRDETQDRRAIAAYHEVLAAAGSVIGQARAQLVSEFSPRVNDAFAAISGDPERLGLRYEPRVTPELGALRAALEASFEKDLARGFTAEGPHADELLFALDGVAVKRYGSQGQQRAIVLSVKVAELHELTRRVGRVPILLLDDVSSELDRTRSRRLFGLLAELGGQVFLTTTQPELILLGEGRRDFVVREGVVREG
jgi:DNA replication and repair protein RecF